MPLAVGCFGMLESSGPANVRQDFLSSLETDQYSLRDAWMHRAAANCTEGWGRLQKAPKGDAPWRGCCPSLPSVTRTCAYLSSVRPAPSARARGAKTGPDNVLLQASRCSWPLERVWNGFEGLYEAFEGGVTTNKPRHAGKSKRSTSLGLFPRTCGFPSVRRMHT